MANRYDLDNPGNPTGIELPVAVASPAPSAFQVTCPMESGPGQTINIQIPGTNQPFAVTVPEGVAPGQQFQVSVPVATATAQATPVRPVFAQAVHNPIQQPQVVYAEDAYGQTVAIVMEDVPNMTPQEERLLPMYQLGRAIKSAGATDAFFVGLWALFFWAPLFALMPFALCGYWAGKRFERCFAYFYLLYHILFTTLVVGTLLYVYQHKAEDLHIWLILLAAIMVLIGLSVMRVNCNFISKLGNLSVEDRLCLQSPSDGMRINSRFRSGSAW